VPSFIDVFGPIAARPTWATALEIAIVVLAVPDFYRALRGLGSIVRSLPIRSPGRIVLLAFLAGAVLAVVFRTELYPFSNVGMFSAVPGAVDAQAPRTEPSVVFVAGSRIEPIAVLREGSALAATLGTGWDYKTGWTMYMFGTTHSVALRHADAVAKANGFERAARALVTYDPRTGRDLGVQPYRR
jgi:hypothetical protein